MMWPVGWKLPRLVAPILTLTVPLASVGLMTMVSAPVVPPTTRAVLLGSVGSACRATAVIVSFCEAAALVPPSLSVAGTRTLSGPVRVHVWVPLVAVGPATGWGGSCPPGAGAG